MVIIYGKVSCIELLVLYTLKKQYYTTPLKSHDSCGCARASVINVNHITIAQLDCVSSLLPLHSLSHRDVFTSTASAHDWWQGTPARLLPPSVIGSEAIVSAAVVRQVVMAALQQGPRPCLLHVLCVSLRTRIITCCLLLAWRRHSFQLEVSALWCIKTYLCSTVSQQHLNHSWAMPQSQGASEAWHARVDYELLL